MTYDIGDLVEDAFVAYLKTECGGMLVQAAGGGLLQFPCAVVLAEECSMLSERISFGPHRRLVVRVSVMTEAAEEIDAGAIMVRTIRQRNAAARNSVLTALNILDSAAQPAGLSSLAQSGDLPKGLAMYLCIQQIPGVWIQSAQPAVPYIAKSVDDEHKAYVSTISLSVIAQAVEIM